MGIATFVVLGGAGFYFATKSSSDEKKEERETIEITRRTIEQNLYINGVVKPGGVVDIFPTTRGTLLKFLAVEGQKVQKGDPLFEMKPDKDSQNDIERAKMNVERYKIEKDLLSEKIKQQKKTGEFLFLQESLFPTSKNGKGLKGKKKWKGNGIFR